MGKHQYVQLAHTYKLGSVQLYGRYASEKLDGQRFIWDGGRSRGIPKSQVPYANTGRDERYQTPPIATGLWSRYGNVIHAPEWFLDEMPNFPLDGEFYGGRNKFQFVQSTIKRILPVDADWENIKAIVLDAPPASRWLAPRTINETNIKLTIRANALEWWNKSGFICPAHNATFEDRLRFLTMQLPDLKYVVKHQQIPLPMKGGEEFVTNMLANILEAGGEGVIIKWRSGLYECERSHSVLKYKPYSDAEAKVIGYYWGDLPDNTRSVSGEAIGKNLGGMGSMIVEFEGKRFKLGNGFKESERYMVFKGTDTCAADVGILNPGKLVGDDVESREFKRGQTITFRYRELSDIGLPKEARYLRTRSET